MYFFNPIQLSVHISEQTTLCCTNRKQKHMPPQTTEIEIGWSTNVGYIIISTTIISSHFRQLQ